jgi:hypothetical protein
MSDAGSVIASAAATAASSPIVSASRLVPIRSGWTRLPRTAKSGVSATLVRRHRGTGATVAAVHREDDGGGGGGVVAHLALEFFVGIAVVRPAVIGIRTAVRISSGASDVK